MSTTTMATTPLLALASVLAQLGMSQSELARASGLSQPAVNRLVRLGQWPARGQAAARTRIESALRSAGARGAQITAVFAHGKKQLAPACLQHAEAAPVNAEPTEPKEEEPMLLKNETLTPAARTHFKLKRNPFVDDIQSRADVFASQNGRYVRAALWECAQNHGFVAIIGESGSGKTTLREDLQERIREERKPVVLIQPYARARARASGNPMQPTHIEAAMFRALGAGVPRKSNPDDRSAQINALLAASLTAGYTHLLLIEEAHRLPVDTLKQLKNFMEMKHGMRRLLGVALIGQPELRDLLTERNAEVREIVQRCEQITMEPLDADLEGYLTHKLERAGVKLADVLEHDALDAIRARLISMPRGGRVSDAVSVCYPLVVNNLVCRALNAAAAVGFPKVDAQVIAGC